VIIRDAAQAPSGSTIAVTVARGTFRVRSEGEIPEASSADMSDRERI